MGKDKGLSRMIKKAGFKKSVYLSYTAEGTISELINAVLRSNKKKFNKKFLKKLAKLKDNEFLSQVVLFHKFHSKEDVDVNMNEPNNSIGFKR